MRKFTALYINEMIKISRKIVVIIICAILLVGIVLVGGVMKMEESMTNNAGNTGEPANWYIESIKSELENYKLNLAELDKKIAAATNEEEKASLLSEKTNLEFQIEMYQTAVDEKINLYSSSYKAAMLNEITNAKIQLAMLDKIPDSEKTASQKTLAASLSTQISEYQEILKTKNFQRYIEYLNEKIDQSADKTADEKKIEKENNLLWLKLDPDGTISEDDNKGNFLTTALMQIKNLKLSLLDNIDYASITQTYMKPLSPDERKDVEDTLAVALYKADKGMLVTQNSALIDIKDTAVNSMLGFGTFMIVCMMLILAGGAVSQEVSTGSIKSLIISPTRRYKIFFAKLASLLTVGIIVALFTYFFSILTSGIFFGFSNGTPYVFAVNGNAMELNFYLYKLAYLFIDFIDVIVYAMFAYMLSILTRNTAASVGISIAVYFGGSLVNTFISLLSSGEWQKFIPFNNLSLNTRIFPNTLSPAMMNMFGMQVVKPSVLFSLIYLAVFILCMGYTAMDSFNRRDIK